MRWVWYVACLEEISNAWEILVGDVKGEVCVVDAGTDVRLISKWVLKE